MARPVRQRATTRAPELTAEPRAHPVSTVALALSRRITRKQAPLPKARKWRLPTARPHAVQHTTQTPARPSGVAQLRANTAALGQSRPIRELALPPGKRKTARVPLPKPSRGTSTPLTVIRYTRRIPTGDGRATQAAVGRVHPRPSPKALTHRPHQLSNAQPALKTWNPRPRRASKVISDRKAPVNPPHRPRAAAIPAAAVARRAARVPQAAVAAAADGDKAQQNSLTEAHSIHSRRSSHETNQTRVFSRRIVRHK